MLPGDDQSCVFVNTVIFKPGIFSVLSGRKTDSIIQAENFDGEDWLCFAQMIAERYPNFEMVRPISSHGDKLAYYLNSWCSHGGILLVDFNLNPDAFELSRMYHRTRRAYQHHEIQGFAVFASVGSPTWIRSLWALDPHTEPWQEKLE